MKTSIAFGLVYIPVSLTPAARSGDVGFNLIDKRTNARISYKKTAKGTDEPVEKDDIVRGYKVADGRYVIFSDEDLDKLKTKKDKQINIEQFVDLAEIDPVYYEKSYYLSPTGGEKAFALLHKTLAQQNKVGLAKTILGSKETPVALRVAGGKMILSTLYFSSEILPAPALKDQKVLAAEIKLAKTLVESMSRPFDPDEYRDEYRERILAAVEQKIAGKEISDTEEAPQKSVLNLMDALRASLSAQSGATLQ